MVKLKDIRKDNEYISAVYTPENSTEEGYVKIKVADNSVVEKRLTEMDGSIGFYFCHVRNALREMIQEIEIPKERTLMWY